MTGLTLKKKINELINTNIDSFSPISIIRISTFHYIINIDIIIYYIYIVLFYYHYS